MKYAYVDYAGIFHITKSEAIAKSHGRNGKYETTKIPAKGGYPYVEGYGSIIYYGGKEVKKESMLPYVTNEMIELYNKLK
jgi:hypothetical protein